MYVCMFTYVYKFLFISANFVIAKFAVQFLARK
jgi:hypothetical protein